LQVGRCTFERIRNRPKEESNDTLPHRIPWLAHPSLPQARVKEVDFAIDGKTRWIEHRAPYSYGDDGEYLVTSWLAPGTHRFTVTAVATSGTKANDTIVARVLPAPAPPAGLAGSWRRDVDTSSLGKLPPGIEQPSGTYTLVLDKRWLQTRFPGKFIPGDDANASVHNGHGWIIDADWTASSKTIYVEGGVNFQVLTDNVREGGWWCGPGIPGATYRWAVSGNTLTLTPIGRESCRYRKIVFAGQWTRSG
jgi:hypothetical protein